jgi:hypothetical protein
MKTYYATPVLHFKCTGRVTFRGSERLTRAAATRNLSFAFRERLVHLLILIRSTQFRTSDEDFEAVHEDEPLKAKSNRHKPQVCA